MALRSRGRLTFMLAATVLLMQTVISLPTACGCSTEQSPVAQTCCHQEPPACEQPVATNSCCGRCGEHATGAPVTPSVPPKPQPRDVDIAINLPHLVATSATRFSAQNANSSPHARCIVDSVQSLLCIWRI